MLSSSSSSSSSSSTMTRPRLMLLLTTATFIILIKQCDSFVGSSNKQSLATRHTSPHHNYPNTVLFDTTQKNEQQPLTTGENDTKEEEEEEAVRASFKEENTTTNNNNNNRRHFLLKFPPALALSTALASGAIIPNAASSATAVATEDDDKIVLSTSSSNFPKHRYEMSSESIASSESSSSSSPLSSDYPLTEVSSPVTTTSTSSMCGDDVESRRIAVFERAAPSVVFIDTFVEQRDAFTTNVMEVPLGSGSGIVWDEKGHIVTNYHVVRQAQSAQVAILTKVVPKDDDQSSSSSDTIFPKRRQQQGLTSYTSMRPGSDPSIIDYKRAVYQAKVVGVDPGKDIAVLKVDAPKIDLYPIDLGLSKNVRVGQSVLAIGNPFGLDHTLTSGIISGLGREVKSPIGRPITNVIQTDAAINPGNSGGPLLDSYGRLIGLNTAIYSPSGASAGIGFAIPVDSVKFIVETLIRDGKVVRGVLGISYLESSQAKALGITRGVLVLDVPENSPAFKAGMRGTTRSESGLITIGDIIVRVEDEKINKEADLFQALEAFKPGDRVRVTVDRAELTGPTGRDVKIKQVVLIVELKASPHLAKSNRLYNTYKN